MLKLKDVAYYLPYNMRAQVTIEGKEEIFTIVDKFSDIPNPVATERKIADFVFYIDRFKPILKRLEDFTEEEWLEVFKAGLEKISFLENFFKGDGFVRFHLGSKAVTFYLDTMTFLGHSRLNQHKAFQMIYEKMGDVGGLINKGLAIDIKKLELMVEGKLVLKKGGE